MPGQLRQPDSQIPTQIHHRPISPPQPERLRLLRHCHITQTVPRLTHQRRSHHHITPPQPPHPNPKPQHTHPPPPPNPTHPPPPPPPTPPPPPPAHHPPSHHHPSNHPPTHQQPDHHPHAATSHRPWSGFPRPGLWWRPAVRQSLRNRAAPTGPVHPEPAGLAG